MNAPRSLRGKYRMLGGFIAAIALVSFLPANSSPAVAESAQAAECERIAGISKAPELSDEKSADGSQVHETSLPSGKSVPVIVVHGFTARSAHSSVRDGTFSHKIDLSALKTSGDGPSGDRSVIGQIQSIAGTAVYTFDYHETAARWVTDESIAPRLAEAITCLTRAHGEKAIIVAHSMGGLATRSALALLDGEPADMVSDVITFGTPNTGSAMAAAMAGTLTWESIFPQASGGAITALRALLTACGTQTSKSLEDTGACGSLPGFLGAFDSDAGRALRSGSAQLDALPGWPNDVAVHSLAGNLGLEVTNMGWFGLERKTGRIETGDLVVGLDSAEAETDSQREVSCDYTLNIRAAAADNLIGAMKLKPLRETRDNAYTNVTSSACFHNNLTRAIELTNEMTLIIVDTLNAIANREATKDSVLNAAIPAGACAAWGDATQLNGSIPLDNGTGEQRDASGEFLGITVLNATVVGKADIDADGNSDFILNVPCTGSEIKYCCAGRSSIMSSIAAVNLTSENELRLVGAAMEAGESLPGNEYGPAARKIASARMDGDVLVTTEYVIYPFDYTSAQVGGDPNAPVTVRHRFRDGRWVPVD